MSRLRWIPATVALLALAWLVWLSPSAAGQSASPVIAQPAGEAIPAAALESRRQALYELLAPGIAVLRGSDRKAEYEYAQDSDFRQDNNFYYLTGLETPGSWLVLYKPAGGPGRTVLYLPEPDGRSETWTGPQIGPGPEAVRLTGIGEVLPASQFRRDIIDGLGSGALGEVERLYLPSGGGSRLAGELVSLAGELELPLVDLSGPLAQLRLVKDSLELERLRRAIDITVEAQRAAMAGARPGMFEYEIEAVVEYVFRSQGAERVGFPTIVGSGPNSVILHYDKNRRRTGDADLVVIDAGAEYGYYTADVTRTFPVNGKFTSRQRAIYELVLATQQFVIDSVRPGMTPMQLNGLARAYLRDHSNGLCGARTCDRHFLHGVGHWLGMDVHDVGSYATPLAAGMVLTIEPGLYLADENLGVRIEDDVLVTETGHEVLSSGAPRTVEEIEALVGSKAGADPGA